MALRLTAGVGLGRDDHHAELNLAAGVRCQQFVHDGRLLLVAQHHTGALGDDDRGIVFVFEKVIDGRFQRRADGAESGNGRVDRTVFDLAYHGGRQVRHGGKLAHADFFAGADSLKLFAEIQFFHCSSPECISFVLYRIFVTLSREKLRVLRKL